MDILIVLTLNKIKNCTPNKSLNLLPHIISFSKMVNPDIKWEYLHI